VQATALAIDSAGRILVAGTCDTEFGIVERLDGIYGSLTAPATGPLKSGVARLTYDLIYTNNFDKFPPGCLQPDCPCDSC